MNVLVVGSGGREHALVWKFAQSPSVQRVLWAPGNPAAKVSEKVQIRNVPAEDIQGLLQLAKSEKVDLTMVGPEAPLVLGIGDLFRKEGLAIFGPNKDGAQLEGSKVFSKKFFLKHKIPTGRAEVFTKFSEAAAYAKKQPKPIVIKADGLAAGKGVIICKDDAEAEKALEDILKKKVFGDAGSQVLIEECLSGPEVSVHALTDGKSFKILASAQDHKRALDGDHGLNTGGMGAYSPAPIFTEEIYHRVHKEIFERTLQGLKAEGISYCGVLYAGLMLTKEGPKILEYNCRFGDPETQVILTRLEADFANVLLSATQGKLGEVEMNWKEEPSVCVIMAAGGYPGSYNKGDEISGLESLDSRSDVQVFHAGTALKDGKVVTAGGRVLGVTALGKDLHDAVRSVYSAVDLIQFQNRHFRKDIAAKALTQKEITYAT
jgi:phosphoribosylamine---glycine ligase